MPILKQAEETKEITLPESGAKLTILSGINYGMMLKIWELPDTDKRQMLTIAAQLITDWDFTDEKGEKIPVTSENLEKLSKEDGVFLIKEISGYFDQKKTSI